MNLFRLSRSRSIAIAVLLFAWFAPSIHATDFVIVILDDSGSMNERMHQSSVHRIDAARDALTAVVQQFDKDTQFGLMLLNGSRKTKHWLIPIGPLHVSDAIEKIKQIRADGGTLLGNAMREACDEMLKARAKLMYGNYRLIVISDGEANDQKSLDHDLPDIMSRGIVVDVIGVDMRQDHSLATRVHSYRRADDEKTLKKAIDEILAENTSDDTTAQQADFDLLNALQDVDTREILKALASPNNSPIGTAKPSNAASTTNNAAAPSVPGTNPPIGNGPASNPDSTSSKLGALIEQTFRTVCTCMLPLLIGLIIFISIATKKRRK